MRQPPWVSKGKAEAGGREKVGEWVDKLKPRSHTVTRNLRMSVGLSFPTCHMRVMTRISHRLARAPPRSEVLGCCRETALAVSPLGLGAAGGTCPQPHHSPSWGCLQPSSDLGGGLASLHPRWGQLQAPALPMGPAEASKRPCPATFSLCPVLFPLPFHSRGLLGHSEHTPCVSFSISQAVSQGGRCDRCHVRQDTCLSGFVLIRCFFV